MRNNATKGKPQTRIHGSKSMCRKSHFLKVQPLTFAFTFNTQTIIFCNVLVKLILEITEVNHASFKMLFRCYFVTFISFVHSHILCVFYYSIVLYACAYAIRFN